MTAALTRPEANCLHVHYWPDRGAQRGPALVAAALARYGDAAKITRRQSGKLEIPGTGWQVSVSHKHERALVALGLDNDLGADLENLRPRRFTAIAQHVFHEAEVAAVTTSADQASLFYRLWTRKEALAKLGERGVYSAVRRNLMDQGAVIPDGEFTRLPDIDDVLFASYALKDGFIATLAVATTSPPEVLWIEHQGPPLQP